MATKEKLLNEKAIEIKRLGALYSAQLLTKAIASGNMQRVPTTGKVKLRTRL